MLHYDRIDTSEGIDVDRTNKSKECMLCHYWYFRDVGYKSQPYLCNDCHAVSMMAYELKNIAILSAKDVDVLWKISRDEAVNRLNNSVLEDKGVLQMVFSANTTPVSVIEEGAFGATYFRDIYSNVNENWYKKSWKEFKQLKNIDQKYYCSDYYDISVYKYGIKCRALLRFWENKGWINEIDPYGWF